MKLSPAMKMTLKKMNRFDRPLCAWELRVGVNTLEALARRKLVKCINPKQTGWLFSPRTTIVWELTNLGKASHEHFR